MSAQSRDTEPTDASGALRVLEESMAAVLDGCVWSQTMTHASLVTYLIEESYELVEAIETNDSDLMLEELGDVLLQVVFHSEIARRSLDEGFSLADVARVATEKMVRRHPHVFGDENAETIADVLRVWSAAKAAEKSTRSSALDGIPQGLPALALADKTLGRAARVGLAPQAGGGAPVRDESELGAALFDLVVAARAQGLDPERALRTHLRGVWGDIRTAEGSTA